jgi:hypothetical protein
MCGQPHPAGRAHLIGAARVEERGQDIGERVAGEKDATEDRGVADGARLMLNDLVPHCSPVRGGHRAPVTGHLSGVIPPSTADFTAWLSLTYLRLVTSDRQHPLR